MNWLDLRLWKEKRPGVGAEAFLALVRARATHTSSIGDT